MSDGLSTDLSHLCRASGVHAEIDETALPIYLLARRLGHEAALRAALHGGEDYELLFSAPADVRVPASVAGVKVTRIGRLTRRRSGSPMMTLMASRGERVPLEPAGWEHFAKSGG